MVTERRTLVIEAKVNDFATKSFAGMGRAVASFSKLGIDSMRSFGRFITDTRNLVTGFLGVFAVRQGFRLLDDLTASLERVAEMSDEVGATTKSLQQLKFIADLNGAAFDQLATTGLGTFIKNLSAADRGSREMAAAADVLGVSLASLPLGEGGKVDVVELFARLADNTQLAGDRLKTLAAVQTLFGSSGRDLNSILALQGAQIRALGQEAVSRGLVFSDENIERAGRFNDALTRLEASLKGLAQTAVIEVAPALTKALETVDAIIPKIPIAFEAFKFLTGQGSFEIANRLRDELASVERQIVQLEGLRSSSLEAALDPEKSRQAQALQRYADRIRDALTDSAKMLTLFRELEGAGADQAAAWGEAARGLERAMSSIMAAQTVSTPTLSGFDPRMTDQVERMLLQLERPTREVRIRLAELDTSLAQGKLRKDLEAAGLSAEDLEAKTTRAFHAMQRELAETKRLIGGDFFLGFSTQLDVITDQWTDMSLAGAEAANAIVHGGLSTVSTELGNVIARTKSWSDAMRDGARVMVQALSQVIARLVVVQTLQSFLGGFSFGFGGGGAAAAPGFTPVSAGSPFPFERGGVMRGAMLAKMPLLGFERGGVMAGDLLQHLPLKMYEAGGIARSPQLAIFGEGKASKGEAFVPLPDGRSIPVTMRGGTRGDVVFNFSFNSMDSQDVQRVLMRSRHTIIGLYTQALGHDRTVRSSVQRAAQI
jgi:hypothetical protein